MSIISITLLATIKKHYKLRWMGTHGVMHWSRVYKNGVILSDQTGVNRNVLELFSILHDSQRHNEHTDKNHGKRGAELAIKLRQMIPLNDAEFTLLTTACELHTNTLDHHDITVQACMDADRLDIGRVNIMPNPDLLCTPMAKQKDTIEKAYYRSINNHELPDQPFGLG